MQVKIVAVLLGLLMASAAVAEARAPAPKGYKYATTSERAAMERTRIAIEDHRVFEAIRPVNRRERRNHGVLCIAVREGPGTGHVLDSHLIRYSTGWRQASTRYAGTNDLMACERIARQRGIPRT